jgi:DNA-binding transcriptional ArsR family regulator
MGVWVVGADVLARSRFTISPLAETVATFFVLRGAPNRPGQLANPAELRAAFRRRLAGDPVGAAFVRAATAPRWVADFLCTPPSDDDATFAGELHRIRSAPAAELRTDLIDHEHTERRTAGPVRYDPALDAGDLPDRVADVLAWVWAEAVEPDWPRRSRAFEADMVARTRRLSTGGWAAALDDMRPGMKWLGEGRLRINAYDYPPRDLADGQLLFVPTTGGNGWVGWDPPHRYSVVYPCSGLLADSHAAAPDALRRLIGPARATVLALLDAPMSTTQIVAVTGFALGSVGNHLKVLLDAGLVRRRRSGRSVLYFRTGGGDALVRPGSRSAAGTPPR